MSMEMVGPSAIVRTPNGTGDKQEFSARAADLDIPENQTFIVRKRYLASWGIGARLSVCGWVLVLILPFCIAMLSVESHEIPASMIWISVWLLVGLCIFLMLAIFVAPSAVLWDSGMSLSVRASPCNVEICKLAISEIKSTRRVWFTHLWRMRFLGFPTDWARSVAIELKSGRVVVLSLKEADEFVSEVNAIILV